MKVNARLGSYTELLLTTGTGTSHSLSHALAQYCSTAGVTLAIVTKHGHYSTAEPAISSHRYNRAYIGLTGCRVASLQRYIVYTDSRYCPELKLSVMKLGKTSTMKYYMTNCGRSHSCTRDKTKQVASAKLIAKPQLPHLQVQPHHCAGKVYLTPLYLQQPVYSRLRQFPTRSPLYTHNSG